MGILKEIMLSLMEYRDILELNGWSLEGGYNYEGIFFPKL